MSTPPMPAAPGQHDPRIPAAYAPRPGANADGAAPADRSADPLRFCVFTTIALLAWVVGPPAVVAAMSALGLRAYVRAVRGGLTESRCVLRRPRLVLAYLAAACAVAVAALAYALVVKLRG